MVTVDGNVDGSEIPFSPVEVGSLSLLFAKKLYIPGGDRRSSEPSIRFTRQRKYYVVFGYEFFR